VPYRQPSGPQHGPLRSPSSIGAVSACAVQAIRSTYLGLLALLEERVLTGLVGRLVLGEVAVLANLVQNLRVDTLQVDRGRGSDHISGVYPSQRNAVDFERSGDKEDTLGKVLEENDTLAAETTSEEDDDGSGLEGCPRFRRTDRLAGLESRLAELSTRRSRPFRSHQRCNAAAMVLRYAIVLLLILLFAVHRCGSALVNIPSWGRRRPQPGSTCSPFGASVPLCWPPFRIVVVVGLPWKLVGLASSEY
jgi:hypothetical protein